MIADHPLQMIHSGLASSRLGRMARSSLLTSNLDGPSSATLKRNAPHPLPPFARHSSCSIVSSTLWNSTVAAFSADDPLFLSRVLSFT